MKDPGARKQYVVELKQEAESRAGLLSPATRARLASAMTDSSYLREACSIQHLNAHCYRLRAHRREPDPGSVRLYVRAAGLTVAPDCRPPASFPWASIGKLSFERRKFEIRAGESRITLYSSADGRSELLLALCKDTHQFSMKIAHEYERERRISLVSATGSDATSGIASERAQSEDEPDSAVGRILPPVASSETSGVYTATSSAAQNNGDSDSLDGVTPFRPRADSGASATGSFRGDGSDPAERNRGLLTAEELTDLIVGRTVLPTHCIPDIPDSESDYITLPKPNGPSYLPGHEDTAPSEDYYPCPPSPPPPVPPKRIDSVGLRAHIDSIIPPLNNGMMRNNDFSSREVLNREPPPYPGRSHSTIFATPAPPPPPLTVYTSQLARSQIEQYRRQLYSDADYVVYPFQDPAISHRDYLDSKLISACPRGALCRALSGSANALSDTYVRLPPNVSTTRREPPPPPFTRTLSEDSILDGIGRPNRIRRDPPPPPPPPPYPRRPPPLEPEPLKPASAGPIDIKTLREKSKNLDLPLISALCNDKSLLKQTEAFVVPRHGEREVRKAVLGGGGKNIRRGCHRHPGDALPALPIPSPRATANTYVPDPRPPAIA